MFKLTIEKSFYYSVGKRFGWKLDGFSEVGIGIAKEHLVYNKEIIINVDKIDYYLNCTEAVNFIKNYKSFETIKGVRIGYVSKDLLAKTV